MHGAQLAVVVVDRVVQGAAIVPQGQRARGPAEAAGVFRADGVLAEIVQQGGAFLHRHVLEAQRVGDVDVERLPAGFRVGADDGVAGLVEGFGVVALAVLDAVFAGAGDIGLGGGGDVAQAFEQLLHAGGEGFVGQGHVGEEGVAAMAGDFAGDQHRGGRGLLQIGGVAVPDAAEIDLFVRQLEDGDDLREAVDALHEGVFDGLAEAAGEGEEVGRGQCLAAEEDDVVGEPDLADLGDLGIRRAGEVDALDLGADGAGELGVLDGHRWFPPLGGGWRRGGLEASCGY